MAGENLQLSIKTLRLPRVRCAAEHKDLWLRRLYVLWAAVKPDGTRDSDFHIGQTDGKGYLSVPGNSLDPHPETVQPLVSDIDYLFYFIRHPGDDLPKKILSEVNGGSTAWGEAKKYRLQNEVTGKDKTKNPITELVLRIPEDPTAFTPVGSDFYQKWVLFRGMPGTGDGLTVKDVQCPPLLEQVRRLQFHLGALRYWIGNAQHPYFPESKNEGVFEVVTWNSVLAFQRDAEAGKAVRLDKNDNRKLLLTENVFDPTADARNVSTQINQSQKYVAGTVADEASAKSTLLSYKTVVDKETGDAIKKWLENGLRKPGYILIAHSSNDTWMNSRVLESFTKLSDKLKELGFPIGLWVSNALRNPVGLSTDGGKSKTSLHKSGFAMDLTMDWHEGQLRGSSPYPLYYELKTVANKKLKTTVVYALVDDDKIPKTITLEKDAQGNITKFVSTESFVEYTKTINNFVYDGKSATGGQGVSTSIPGKSFLNFTKVANQFGFVPINPHLYGWMLMYEEKQLTLLDTAAFENFVKRLGLHIAQLKDGEQLKRIKVYMGEIYDTMTVNGVSYKILEFEAAKKTLGIWQSVAGRHGANPEIKINPTTKEGEKLVAELKRNKKIRNIKFTLTYHDSLANKEVEQEILITKDSEFPPEDFRGTEFTMKPVTAPVSLKPGDIIKFPQIVGDPSHLEWWHFQYLEGYKGRKWSEILGDIGWTIEGLLGKSENNHIYGLFGVGYNATDMAIKEG